MGGGKNYWGENFANFVPNALFFDGDTVIPAAMRERVVNFKPLTREMIEEYIEILIEKIELQAEQCRHLIVAQALYFDEDRKEIKKYFESLGYFVQMYWVRPSWWKNIRNIFRRPQPFKWLVYWLLNKPYFQKPTHHYALIG